jgi:hypothetical protein
MARQQQGRTGRDGRMQYGRTLKLLGIKVWRAKANDRQLWMQCIQEAKT